MRNQVIHAGGVFDVASFDAAGSRDIAQFRTVGAQAWPPGPQHSVQLASKARPIGFSKVGMGQEPSASVARAIAPASPIDSRAIMIGRAHPFDMTGAVARIPGFTPKGGILEGSTVGTGQPGGGQYFEAREPRVIGSGVVARSLPDPALRLPRVGATSIMPTESPLRQMVPVAHKPRPVPTVMPTPRLPRPTAQNRCPAGYRLVVDMVEGPKCVPDRRATSGFGSMYGQSLFGGAVASDRMPKQTLMPSFAPINGFGAGPDGLGAGPDGLGCGCGAWKQSG